MLISDSNQFIFVHIRKTAGTSLRQTIETVSLPKNSNLLHKLLSRNGVDINYHDFSFRKHSPLIQAERSMSDELFRKYFKFAIVRNPYDRLVSEFEYIKSKPEHSRNKKINRMTFEQFVKFQSTRFDAHQTNMLINKEGFIDMDYIGRFENLTECFNEISDKAGIDCRTTHHIHKIERKHYKEYYSDKLIEKVAKLWQADLENFSYKFDG